MELRRSIMVVGVLYHISTTLSRIVSLNICLIAINHSKQTTVAE